MDSAIKLKRFSDIHLLLKVFHFEAFVNCIADKSFTNKSTSMCNFDKKYFYRLLLAINCNVDFIVNSIDIIRTIKYSCRVQENIFIGAYRQLIAT